MVQLGMGVMLQRLGGNEETSTVVKSVLNKKIEKVWLDEETNELKVTFIDNTGIKLWDGGQSCCESRYMKTDDDLKDFVGAKLLDMELKDVSYQEGDYEVHEIQFLDVKTDKGVFQMANHNEHNGYYSGFFVQAAKL